MENTLVFLDGGFISKLNKYFGEDNYISYDLIKFAKHLAKKQDLFCKHVFYYNAPPFQQTPPTQTLQSTYSTYQQHSPHNSQHQKPTQEAPDSLDSQHPT